MRRARANGRPGAQLGVELHAPPPGLRPDEERWLLARAARAGGLTAAFRGLVDLVILYEACAVLGEHCEQIRRHGQRGGRDAQDIERAVDAWSRECVAWRLRERLMNMLHDTRPGLSDGYGGSPVDDPTAPLPRAAWRQLIAEGRTFFESRVTGKSAHPTPPTTASAAGRPPVLRGLSPEKQRWLRQRSALVGGLDSALCFLVRATMRGAAASNVWRAQAQPASRASGPGEEQP